MKLFRLILTSTLFLALSAQSSDLESFAFQPDLSRTNFPNQVRVDHKYFTVVAPTGWSLNSTKAAVDGISESITFTPTADTSHDPIYLGVHVRKSPPVLTLEEQRKKQIQNQKWQTSYKSWGKQKWLYSEYEEKNNYNQIAHCILAKSQKNRHEFWAIACAPKKIAEPYLPQFEKIFQSIQLK